MLIRRCAWHRQHFGFSVLLGVAEWSGQTITYTDGICRRCAALERRRLGIGDLATTTAARTMRRQALARAMVLALVAGALTALVAATPRRSHEASLTIPLRLALPGASASTMAENVGRADAVPVEREQHHAVGPSPTGPAPSDSRDAQPPSRYAAVYLPDPPVRSWNQLTRASEGGPARDFLSAAEAPAPRQGWATFDAPRPVTTFDPRPLAVLEAEWGPRPVEPYVVAFAPAPGRSREILGEAP
jgi:hypothetical protein